MKNLGREDEERIHWRTDARRYILFLMPGFFFVSLLVQGGTARTTDVYNESAYDGGHIPGQASYLHRREGELLPQRSGRGPGWCICGLGHVEGSARDAELTRDR